ncbi:MAG: ParB/RepB/Spo0J family partition protein [Ancrocorticia sp.]|nr:ParB/RepB/Spo0J family partition protein [Ancrocorticia sp.]
MAQRRRGLGRGIGALIPESQEEVRESPISVFFGGAVSRETDKKKTATPATSSGKTEEQALENENELVPVPGATYAELPVSAIIPNRKQPRSVFDDDELNELADSIRQVGVLQPVIVRPLDEPIPESPSARYELIMGERRWRASERAEMETIPAIVRRTADEDLLRDALLENLHRAQLNPLEEAAAYQQLLDDFGCSQEELSKRIARSRPQISNTLRLLKLPPLVQRRVAAHVISAGHARALLGLSDPAAMERLAQRIVAEGLSVRQVEEIVAVGDEPSITPARHRRAKRYASELGELSVRLADRFDTKVKVELGQYKGAIRIDFASIDDLNRILRILAPEEDDISISE